MALTNPLRTAFDGMVRARQRQANRQVADILGGMDAETLRRAGYDAARLRRLRNGRSG